MYNTDFVVTIVDEFWSLYQMSIFIAVFIPFLFYFQATLTYFTFYLAIPDEDRFAKAAADGAISSGLGGNEVVND